MSIYVNGSIGIDPVDLHYLSRDLGAVYCAMEEAVFDKKLLQIVQTAIDLAEDIENCVEHNESTDWEKYMDYYEEEDLDPEIKENLSKLRDIIGNETQITVGNNQNGDNGYVTFVNGDLYSNFLTSDSAEDEIRSILTGIKLERERKCQ